MNSELFEAAFVDGATVDGVTIGVHRVADVALTTGAVVACDPLVAPEPVPFVRRVPPGKYPVSLSVAALSPDDQRVAFARIDFAPGRVARWEMATVWGQDPTGLTGDEYFGYGVDAGTGCFMDSATAELLCARMDELAGQPGFSSYYTDVLAKPMEANYRHTWTWVSHEPVAGDPRNLVAFSSGYGDGFYPSFFGLGDDGAVLCLLTDFGVLGDD